MEWTQIIVSVITGLLAGGGLVIIFTRKEIKDGKATENMQKVIDSMKQVIESMQKSLDAKDRIIEEHEARRKELKEDLDKKDSKIETLLKEKSAIRDENDDLKTEVAVTEMLKCIKLKCIERDPPFASHLQVKNIRNTDLVKTAIDNGNNQ